MFLTARWNMYNIKTIEQLSFIGINPNNHNIYYTEGCLDKGYYMSKIYK
jgi:hypothetical protein